MDTSDPQSKSRLIRFVYCASAVLIFGLALLCNEYTARLFDRYPPVSPSTIRCIHESQRNLFVVVGMLLAIAGLMWCVPQCARFLSRPRLAKLQATFFLVILPIIVLEIVLWPVALNEKKTTIYQRDPVYGWKHRPNTTDWFGKVRISINSKGLRGKEYPYERTPGTFRILYLGDSVTFGYKIEQDAQTFPGRTSQRLEQHLSRPVETINAGTDGYSTWQEALFLENEGVKYRPDLVILAFILNDVTERYGLVQFGGTGEGYQLARTVSSRLERFANTSNILITLRKIQSKIRYGLDPEARARRQQELDVEKLVHIPDDPKVVRAWELVSRELTQVYSFCRAQSVPVCVVVFPFTFQLKNPEASNIPQRIVIKHAAQHHVPALDLLLPIADALKVQKLQISDVFFDEDHLTPKGCEMVADMIASFVLTNQPVLIGREQLVLPGL